MKNTNWQLKCSISWKPLRFASWFPTLISCSPNPPRVYIRLCKHGNHFTFLQCKSSNPYNLSMFALCCCKNINLSFLMQNVAIVFIVSLSIYRVSKNFIGYKKGSDFSKTLSWTKNQESLVLTTTANQNRGKHYIE